MADEKAPEEGTETRLDGLVLRDVPFVGTYSTKVFQEKHQSTVPRDLREILKLRQGVKNARDIVLFLQIDEGLVYLSDSPDEGLCPKVRLAKMDMQGRIVLPSAIFNREYATYTGCGGYIEVRPADQPVPES